MISFTTKNALEQKHLFHINFKDNTKETSGEIARLHVDRVQSFEI